MKTTIFIITLSFIILPCTFIGWRFIKNPNRIEAYPFTIVLKNQPFKDVEPESLLLIGDQASAQIYPFLTTVTDDLSSSLRKAIRPIDITREFEGLHRTLHNIKSLNHLPPIILYSAHRN